MKSWIMLWLVSSALIGGMTGWTTVASASTTPYTTNVVTARLSRVELDRGLYPDTRGTNGRIRLDFAKREVQLEVNRQTVCPAGRACAAVMPEPIVVRLPMRAVFKGDCGELVVRAKRDDRDRVNDGVMAALEIHDNTISNCMYVREAPPTEVHFLVENVRGNRFESTLEGEALGPDHP